MSNLVRIKNPQYDKDDLDKSEWHYGTGNGHYHIEEYAINTEKILSVKKRHYREYVYTGELETVVEKKTRSWFQSWWHKLPREYEVTFTTQLRDYESRFQIAITVTEDYSILLDYKQDEKLRDSEFDRLTKK